MLTQRRFSTGPPGVTCVSHQECGKLCGNCEKLLSLCGFQLSPVSTKELFYVNKRLYFSFLKQKTLFFKIGKCPNIQKKRGSCLLYLVSSGNGKNLFPQTVHRDLTYISYLALGAVRPGWKTVQTQRNPYAIPRFCGILAAKPRVFRRVFTKGPQRAACFPRKTRNVYLCTKFVEHRIGRFFP